MDEREMHDEISALIGSVSKAFDVSDMEVITAIEQGRLGLELMTDDQGRNYVLASLDERTAHIYPDAIFRPEDDGGCKTGGCGCGH